LAVTGTNKSERHTGKGGGLMGDLPRDG